MLDIEKLNKLITFITESYVYGIQFLDSEKLQKKRIKISREHLSALLEAMSEMLNEYDRIIDNTDYGLKVKLLRNLLEAYDSLSKGIKQYHYDMRYKEGNIEGLIEQLSEEQVYTEPEEQLSDEQES